MNNKPKCTKRCINNVKGARSDLCKRLSCELQDIHGTYHHEYCQCPREYREG